MGSRDDQNPPVPEGILSAVAYVAREFLRASDWEDAVGRVLHRLGEAAAASRAYVFENRVVDGVLTETQLFEWAEPGIRPTIDDADSFEEPYPPQVERWVRVLSGGGAIAGPTRDLPPAERDYIEGLGRGILSFVFVPVFVESEWWGYLGFDDRESEREWTSAEIDALRTAAEVLGAAIERRSLDRALREAEERYRNLVEQLPAAAYTETADGVLTFIGPQVDDMFGVSPDEWIADQRKWAELIHPEDRDQALSADRAADISGTPFAMEYRMIARDGRTMWVNDTAVLVSNAPGEPPYWQGVLTDVTARKEAEKQARENEERFRVLVEGGTSIVYMDDPGEAGDTIYISPQIEDLLGCTQEEFLEAQDLWVKALHPDDRERIMALEENSHLAGDPYEAEYRVINSRGETTWLHEQARLVNSVNGSPLFWLGVILDITKQKVAEERQREAERDLALEQATSAKLRELDQAKDALLTAVSHDFRAPLSNILGFAATLEESSRALSPDDVKSFVRRISANGWRLERLVADIMEVSRLREGLAGIERMTTDLAGVVERLVEQAALGEKYPVTLESAPVTISVDVPKVERLVQNLITNAVVHNPDGVVIRVQVGPVPGGAHISVEDDGKGVPDDVRSALFEEFTVDEETQLRGAAPGLGLGLSIVKRFAELHGGRVWHEEIEGGGAAFHVFHPGEGARLQPAR